MLTESCWSLRLPYRRVPRGLEDCTILLAYAINIPLFDIWLMLDLDTATSTQEKTHFIGMVRIDPIQEIRHG